MNRIYRIACFAMYSICFFQCQKEFSDISSTEQGLYADQVTGTIQGNITDEFDQPLPGVVITAGKNRVVTNGSGYFRITHASLNKNISRITAEKAGYFKGSRVFGATAGTNQVWIKMIRKSLAGTIDAAAGGSVFLFNGAIIRLPANGVMVASSGVSFAGKVQVYAAYIDPAAADIDQTLPGSYLGDDQTGKKVILSSYGMMAVELESTGGTVLQIRPGTVATLAFPISSKASTPAPATIALWYVDDKTGIWKEEGVAAKQGDTYVGEVRHFSFWNCDIPVNTVTISFTLLYSGKRSLANVEARITDVNSATGRSGYTDSLGQVRGFVPANRELLLELLDPCGNVVYSQNIGPFSSNKDLGVISLSNPVSSITTVSGNLLGCGGLPLINGYAIVKYNNMVRYAKTDGNGLYSLTFALCTSNSSALVTGVSSSPFQQSAAESVTLTAPVSNVKDITACGLSSQEFFNYTLDGISFNIAGLEGDSLAAYKQTAGPGTGNNSVYLEGSHQYSADNYIHVIVNNAGSTGIYPVDGLYVQPLGSGKLIKPFNIGFTNFAKFPGEFYEGSFSGKFIDDSARITHTISSSFKIRQRN